jgi:hypothetical protein
LIEDFHFLYIGKEPDSSSRCTNSLTVLATSLIIRRLASSYPSREVLT